MQPLDTRLLSILDALYAERSVTGASLHLGLSQSAVSHALARLRDIFKDDLFVRTAAGMQPTPLASEICPRMQMALAELRNSIQPIRFEPARSSREFQLVCTTGIIQILAPKLVKRFMKEAPHASISIFAPSRVLVEELSDGGVDLAIGIRRPVPPWIDSELILQDRWVLAFRSDLAPAARSAADVASLPHVAVTLGPRPTFSGPEISGAQANYDDRRSQLKEAGYRSFRLPSALRNRAASVKVAEPSWALWLIEHSDVVAVIPEKLVGGAQRPCPITTLKLDNAAPLEILCFWLKGNHEPPASWFRGLVKEVATSL